MKTSTQLFEEAQKLRNVERLDQVAKIDGFYRFEMTRPGTSWGLDPYGGEIQKAVSDAITKRWPAIFAEARAALAGDV